MIRTAVARLEHKPSFRYFAHEQFVARLQLVKLRRERSLGDQFEEEFNFIFRRGGCDRIWTFDALTALFHPERGVLSRKKVEMLARLNAEHPQIRREVDAPGDSRVVKLVVRGSHFASSKKQKYLRDRRE